MPRVSSLILPLSIEQQQQVVTKTNLYIENAVAIFDMKTAPVDIVFNLKGRAAGMYRVRQRFLNSKREIRYNPYIFSKYFDDNLNTTVPHEVAHYVSDLIYGLKNIKPHGKEWKEIMLAFDADATVTADYNLAGIPQRNMSAFTYQCGCGQHQLSSIRHNRIKKRHYQYYCKICKQKLRYDESTSS